VEKRTGMVERFAACFTDHREAERVEHTVGELVAQRVYPAGGIAPASSTRSGLSAIPSPRSPTCEARRAEMPRRSGTIARHEVLSILRCEFFSLSSQG
jgi:hypothetical protein